MWEGVAMALPERAILDSFYYGYLPEGRMQGAGDPDALRYPADPTITPREKRQLSMGNDTMREVTQQPANRFLIPAYRPRSRPRAGQAGL